MNFNRQCYFFPIDFLKKTQPDACSFTDSKLLTFFNFCVECKYVWECNCRTLEQKIPQVSNQSPDYFSSHYLQFIHTRFLISKTSFVFYFILIWIRIYFGFHFRLSMIDNLPSTALVRLFFATDISNDFFPSSISEVFQRNNHAFPHDHETNLL